MLVFAQPEVDVNVSADGQVTVETAAVPSAEQLQQMNQQMEEERERIRLQAQAEADAEIARAREREAAAKAEEERQRVLEIQRKREAEARRLQEEKELADKAEIARQAAVAEAKRQAQLKKEESDRLQKLEEERLKHQAEQAERQRKAEWEQRCALMQVSCKHGLVDEQCMVCACEGGWEGTHCDQCPLKCLGNSQADRTCSHCVCPTGFVYEDGVGCQDINECEVNNGDCDKLTKCMNTPGHRVCGSCPPNYFGTGEDKCFSWNFVGGAFVSCLVMVVTLFFAHRS